MSHATQQDVQSFAELIILRGDAVCAVLERRADSPPVWRWWGPSLEFEDLPWAGLAADRPTPSFAPDADFPFDLFPTFGGGWFGQSALLAHRGGRDFHQKFRTDAVELDVDGRGAEIVLVDDVARLDVRIRLRIEAGSDVLSLQTTLTNLGEAGLEVQWLAAGAAPLPAQCDRVRAFVGRHLDEFHALDAPLDRFGWRRENRRGLTSHGTFPGALVQTAGAGDFQGLAFGAHLAWSGNHAQVIERLDDGRYQWQMGEWLAPGEVILDAGETIATPQMLLAASAHGLNRVSQAFHAEVRRRLDWPGGAMRPRPVTINTWEGFYFRHDVAALKTMADSAAELGAERFVLDDGWFVGRDDDTAALGDWRPHPLKYPDGLGPLVDHVRALGMEFGLWVEPEMVNPDSDLLRAHPDWALQLAGRATITARNQLVLDMARPEVGDYLFDAIDKLLRAHPIAYLKWDHNRDLAHAAGPDGRARYRRQIEAAYGLMARLRTAHPDVEIEACAGGGGRIDMGVLRHTHRVWTSDNIDAASRAPIQRGFLRFFPPEIMGAHVGASPAHSTGRRQSMSFRAAVALPGHLGVELDPRAVDGRDRERLAAWIAFYKSVRHILHGGRVWQGEGQDGLVWQAHESADGQNLLLAVYRIAPQTWPHAASIPLPFLDRNARWSVDRIDPTGADAWAAAGKGPLWGGDRLAAIGPTAPRLRGEDAALFRLCRRDPG